MSFYDLSIIATLSATFAVLCVYIFLYSLYRQTYIGYGLSFRQTSFVDIISGTSNYIKEIAKKMNERSRILADSNPNNRNNCTHPR